MTAAEVSVVQRKLAIIQGALVALQQAGPIALDRYRADLWRRKGTERFLQEAIEAAIDIATHLVTSAGRPAPADFYSAFIALVDLGVLDAELARALAPAAGLRNRLVHEYDDLDDARVLAAVDEAQKLLPRFMAAVSDWTKRDVGSEPRR